MSGAAARHPIDLAHLAQYTGGEFDINAELLEMFVHQCAQALARLGGLIEARNTDSWRGILHTLKGSALGVGAFPLAEELAAAEDIDPALSPSQASAALETLKSNAEMASRFVAAYRRRQA
ncbi:MAG TPA: Hpt domain-containing protein [Rhizomicrobium sp.]|jgi:HPt (histidine-containing phosphotransfer) domain-containing protein|nr:Hpt domain-containing protein [Rhizomicrobium sp.]